MPNSLKDHGLLIEAMTRARKTLICVTNPGSSFHGLLESAVNHKDATICQFIQDEVSCPFIGVTKILEKDKVS